MSIITLFFLKVKHLFEKPLTQTIVRDKLNTRSDSMKEILESKIFIGFMLFCVGCTYFMTPDSHSDNMVASDSNTISVSDYAYI